MASAYALAGPLIRSHHMMRKRMIAMFTIGTHLSKREGYLAMGMEAAGLGANTFQYFSRNPRGGHVKSIDADDVKAYCAYAAEHDIVMPLAYAPYDVEPASGKMEQRDFALTVMSEDMVRLDEIPGQNYLVRPGSALDESKEEGLTNFAAAINATVHPSQQAKLLICMLAGEGTIGFDALSAMTNNPRLAQLPFYIEEPHSTLAEYREDIERFKAARTA